MTNDKLADEISRQRFSRDDDLVSLNEDQWQQIIAALRRPSSDQVLVPREPTMEMLRAAQNARGLDSILLNDIDVWNAMLAAAEAEKEPC